MFERSSGMDLSQGIEALRAQAIETFKNFVYEMRFSNKLSTKIATKVATEMTTGLFSSIFAQIDPSRIGEIQRVTYIAHHYGNMLAKKSNNIKEDGVSLVLGILRTVLLLTEKKHVIFLNQCDAQMKLRSIY